MAATGLTRLRPTRLRPTHRLGVAEAVGAAAAGVDRRPKPIAAATRPLPELSESERSVYDAIEASETAIDAIAARCNLPSPTVSSVLLRLELKRLVKQLPGKYFVKLG